MSCVHNTDRHMENNTSLLTINYINCNTQTITSIKFRHRPTCLVHQTFQKTLLLTQFYNSIHWKECNIYGWIMLVCYGTPCIFISFVTTSKHARQHVYTLQRNDKSVVWGKLFSPLLSNILCH